MCSIRVCLEAFCLALSNYALEECRKDTGSELPAFAKVCEGENRPPAWDSNPQNGAWGQSDPPPTMIRAGQIVRSYTACIQIGVRPTYLLLFL
jgi:hypothetical protein